MEVTAIDPADAAAELAEADAMADAAGAENSKTKQ